MLDDWSQSEAQLRGLFSIVEQTDMPRGDLRERLHLAYITHRPNDLVTPRWKRESELTLGELRERGLFAAVYENRIIFCTLLPSIRT